MTPEAIYAALTTGAMVGQARDLTDAQKRIIAEFFGGRPLGDADAGDAKNMAGHCDANPPLADPSAQPGWNGWGNGLVEHALSAGQMTRNSPRRRCLR